MGRQVVFFICKLLLLLFVCGVAFGIGGLIYVFLHSPVAAVAAASITLHAFAAGSLVCVGIAFRRFDPSLDAPA
jgi:uncharacterized membrane protein